MKPEQNQNNPSQPNNLTVPQRSNEPPHSNQQRAAVDISRRQVERVYNGDSKHQTPHTTPIIQSEPTNEVQQKILPKTQKIIQPLSQTEKNPAHPIGAVEYSPLQKQRQFVEQKKEPVRNEQWNRYHSAWQNYYQKYYENYYVAAAKANSVKTAKGKKTEPIPDKPLTESEKKNKALYDLKQNISEKARENSTKFRRSKHFFPIISALAVIVIFVFLQYNRLFISNIQAYISPGNSKPQDTIHNPLASVEVSPESKLIIPKINVDVPAIYNVGNDQQSQQKAMIGGVAHFSIAGAESVPGQIGNTVLSGHSSNDLFDSGDYKFIFAQLDRMSAGDIIYANYNGVRYTYNVKEVKIVLPSDVKSLVYQTDKPILTLITCTPLGTAEKRLLVIAEQISPDPSSAEPKEDSAQTKEPVEMPKNSPTFFERLFTWNWN